MILSNSFGRQHLGFGSLRFRGYGKFAAASGALPVLKLGSKGEAVKALQKGLIDVGLAAMLAGAAHALVQPADKTDAAAAVRAALANMTLDQLYAKYADGIFGPKTAEAVWAFKLAHFNINLDPSADPQAVVDEQLWKSLAGFRQSIIDEATAGATPAQVVQPPPPPPPSQVTTTIGPVTQVSPNLDVTHYLPSSITNYLPGSSTGVGGAPSSGPPWGMIAAGVGALGVGAWLFFNR